MNDSFFTNQSNSSQFKLYLESATEITNYGIPIVSALGTLLQIATIVCFSSPWFEHKFYDFLQCRSICNSIVCLIGIFSRPMPCQNCLTDYFWLNFNVYVILLPIRVAILASAITDNLLILNRLVTLYEWKTRIFNQLSKKANIFICYAFSIVAIVPMSFSIKIVKASDSPSESQGYWTPRTEITKSEFFAVVGAIMSLLETLIPLLTLIALNIVSLIKFRKVMENKRQLQRDGQRIDAAINRFTRLILALSVVCIFTRTVDTVSTFLARIQSVNFITLSDEFEALLIFSRRFSFFLMLAEHGLDVLLYYFYDKNFRVFLGRGEK